MSNKVTTMSNETQHPVDCECDDCKAKDVAWLLQAEEGELIQLNGQFQSLTAELKDYVRQWATEIADTEGWDEIKRAKYGLLDFEWPYYFPISIVGPKSGKQKYQPRRAKRRLNHDR